MQIGPLEPTKRIQNRRRQRGPSESLSELELLGRDAQGRLHRLDWQRGAQGGARVRARRGPRGVQDDGRAGNDVRLLQDRDAWRLWSRTPTQFPAMGRLLHLLLADRGDVQQARNEGLNLLFARP